MDSETLRKYCKIASGYTDSLLFSQLSAVPLPTSRYPVSAKRIAKNQNLNANCLTLKISQPELFH